MKQAAIDKHAGELFDMLANGDKTSAEILKTTGWGYGTFMATVQRLRDTLANDGDVISVVAEPQGTRQDRRGAKPYLYRLVAGQTIIDPEHSKWVANRIDDSERRLKTIAAVLDVTVKATDGRTALGKKAVRFHRHVTRALEDISEEV